MKTPIVLALASIMTLSCATPQGTSSLECGAGGALGGYALCKLLGGDDKKCLAAAVLTGVAGGAICYTYAANLQKRQQELAGKENDLDARLRYVRGLNEDTEKLNRQLSQHVAEVTKHTEEVRAKIARKEITQQQLAKEEEALANEKKAANEQLKLAQEQLADMKRFRDQQRGRNTADLDIQIAKLEGLLAQTRKETSALASQRLRV
jgi:ABC-type phosphate transport system auxiliary subunit